MSASVIGAEARTLPLVSNIEFCGLSFDQNYGLVIRFCGGAPPGPARSDTSDTRKRFWEQVDRLQYGGLVAPVTKQPRRPAGVDLALLTSCE